MASSARAATLAYVSPAFVISVGDSQIPFETQLWFAGGDFLYSRFFSKQLVWIWTAGAQFVCTDCRSLQGLQIKAIELGLLQQESQPEA